MDGKKDAGNRSLLCGVSMPVRIDETGGRSAASSLRNSIARPAVESFMTAMRGAEKDRLAESVVDRYSSFEQALAGNRRKYPTREFQLFAEGLRRYVEKIGSDKMIHRDVIGAVHGLVDDLRVERKRVPGEVLVEAERLECLLFLGYDPHVDGDEPPGL